VGAPVEPVGEVSRTAVYVMGLPFLVAAFGFARCAAPTFVVAAWSRTRVRPWSPPGLTWGGSTRDLARGDHWCDGGVVIAQ
jgi:hypothetical protein